MSTILPRARGSRLPNIRSSDALLARISGHYGQLSVSFTAPNSILVPAVIVSPAATLWEHTIQFESMT
jgi:hypothetical protein